MKLVPLFTFALATVYAQQNPLMDAVKARYEAVKQNLIETAEVMPEESYAFKLSPQQRPFGAWIEHTIDMTFSYCSSMRGLASLQREAPDADKKASLVEVLKIAFNYCDESLKPMTDERALTAVTMGTKQVYPVTYMVNMIAGLNEHYGNLVGYLRAKGITPPSTARAQKK
jgi:hypothetical protein